MRASKSESEKADRGCVGLLAIACIAIGIGYLFGAPYGWLLVGVILFLAALA